MAVAINQIVFWIIARLFISLDRPDVRPLLESVVYYEHFCPKGHYLSSEEPVLGTLCKTCIREGHIIGSCGEGGKNHPAKIMTTTPPYKLFCPIHGERVAIVYKIGGRRVSFREWLRANMAEPLPIPLPTYNPLPAALTVGRSKDEMPLLALDPVQRRIKNLEKVLQDRVRKLNAEVAQRRRTLRVWYPGSILLMMLMLMLILFWSWLSRSIAYRAGFSGLAAELSQTAVLILQFLAIVLIVFAALLYAFKRLKRKSRKMGWSDARLSFILAESVALVILPFVLKIPVTLREVLMGLVFDVIAEIIIAMIQGTLNLNALRRQGKHLVSKLKEVQGVLRTIIPTIAYVYGSDSELKPEA